MIKHLLNFSKITKKVGKPPGLADYTGHIESQQTGIEIVFYSSETFKRIQMSSAEALFNQLSAKKKFEKVWINIIGVTDVNMIKEITSHFNIHPLVIEDILNVYQSPKIDTLEEYLFIVLKSFQVIKNENQSIVHIGLLCFEDIILSFQDCEEDIYEGVYERIEKGIKIFRVSNIDYLLYVLVDLVVDHYYHIIEQFSNTIENIEEALLEHADKKELSVIQNLRKEIQFTRSQIWPLREILDQLIKPDMTNFIHKSTVIYLKDTSDHLSHISGMVDSLKESVNALLDLYFSAVSHRLNDIMKILTIISTIFIPLTFIVGVYGMNFKFMPELEWKFGYPVIWIIMLVIGIILGIFFKRKRWF